MDDDLRELIAPRGGQIASGEPAGQGPSAWECSRRLLNGDECPRRVEADDGPLPGHTLTPDDGAQET